MASAKEELQRLHREETGRGTRSAGQARGGTARPRELPPRLLPSPSAEPRPCRAPGAPMGRGSPGAGRGGLERAPSGGSSPGERPAAAAAGEGDKGSSAAPAGRAAGERSPAAELTEDSLRHLAPSLPSFLISLLPSPRSLEAGKTCPRHEGH